MYRFGAFYGDALSDAWHPQVIESTGKSLIQKAQNANCHVGGRGFEPRRPRHLFSITWRNNFLLLFATKRRP